jgi:hypothetical protein
MKLPDGETPLMRKPISSPEVIARNKVIRPEIVSLVVQLLERNHKLKLMKPISPRIQ